MLKNIADKQYINLYDILDEVKQTAEKYSGRSKSKKAMLANVAEMISDAVYRSHNRYLHDPDLNRGDQPEVDINDPAGYIKGIIWYIQKYYMGYGHIYNHRIYRKESKSMEAFLADLVQKLQDLLPESTLRTREEFLTMIDSCKVSAPDARSCDPLITEAFSRVPEQLLSGVSYPLPQKQEEVLLGLLKRRILAVNMDSGSFDAQKKLLLSSGDVEKLLKSEDPRETLIRICVGEHGDIDKYKQLLDIYPALTKLNCLISDIERAEKLHADLEAKLQDSSFDQARVQEGIDETAVSCQDKYVELASIYPQLADVVGYIEIQEDVDLEDVIKFVKTVYAEMQATLINPEQFAEALQIVQLSSLQDLMLASVPLSVAGQQNRNGQITAMLSENGSTQVQFPELQGENLKRVLQVVSNVAFAIGVISRNAYPITVQEYNTALANVIAMALSDDPKQQQNVEFLNNSSKIIVERQLAAEEFRMAPRPTSVVKKVEHAVETPEAGV